MPLSELPLSERSLSWLPGAPDELAVMLAACALLAACGAFTIWGLSVRGPLRFLVGSWFWRPDRDDVRAWRFGAAAVALIAAVLYAAAVVVQLLATA